MNQYWNIVQEISHINQTKNNIASVINENRVQISDKNVVTTIHIGMCKKVADAVNRNPEHIYIRPKR